MYKIIADDKTISAKNVSEWLIEYKNSILPTRQMLGNYYDGKNC